MRAPMVLLLWLAVMPAFATSADWLNWRKVGDATLTWGPFSVYTAQLRALDGVYRRQTQDLALLITYHRTIHRDELADATRDRWQALGILAREPQSQAWLQTLRTLWPDVTPGAQLAFVVAGNQGQFWYRASSQHPFAPLGSPWPSRFSDAFLAIWLDERTDYPALRLQLIGGKP